jgi:hypothetical protein
MKRFGLLVILSAFCACSTLPIIQAPAPTVLGKQISCPSPFLQEKYRLIHAIESSVSGRVQGTMIGVTVADPIQRLVSCAIMSAEGMVMFEAEAGPTFLKINRALPPLDSTSFARNMIDDITLIFFRPEGKLEQWGYLEDGSTVCRYQEKDGGRIDVIASGQGKTIVRRYTSRSVLQREITLVNAPANPYEHVELLSRGMVDYSLIMNLIQAQPVAFDLPPEEIK